MCSWMFQASIFGQTTIVKIEYFFGLDPGFGLAVPVPFARSGNISDLTFIVDVSGLQKGLHYFQIRSQDATGQWSIVNKRMVYREVSSTAAVPNIGYIEYFIDTDPGTGEGTRIPITEDAKVENLTTTIDISALSQGGHYLYVRTRDTEGRFSMTSIKYFEKEDVLPLKLLDYSAGIDDRTVKHAWTTTDETGVSHFMVERSLDGAKFNSVGSVEARNTTVQQGYFYKEILSPSLLTAPVIYYRLKMVDEDGDASYSRVITVTPKKLMGLSISPNPATDFVNISMANASMISISSITGQILYRTSVDPTADTHHLRFNKLPAGVYLLKVLKTNNEAVVEKLLIQ